MKIAEAILSTLGVVIFLAGLVVACLPSAVVRDLLRRVRPSKTA